jgi:hypothetical protein
LLSVAVQTANWVDVDTLDVYINGILHSTRPIDGQKEVSLPLHFESDSFVTVEVYGQPGEIYRAVAGNLIPIAFSNPIYIDADGNGKWNPPGTPLPAPDKE